MRRARVFVLLLLAAGSLPAQQPARERFLEHLDRWRRIDVQKSPEGLLELESEIAVFGTIDYGEDEKTREQAEKLLESVIDEFGADDEHPVRAAAILALGRIAGSAEAGEFLLRIAARPTSDRDLVPEWAARALAGLGRAPPLRRVLEFGLGHRSAAIRRTALDALARLEKEELVPIGREGGPAILAAIEDHDLLVVEAALRAAGRLRLEEALPAIVAKAAAEDALLRMGAARALGGFARSTAAWEALKTLAADPDDRVREEVVGAFAAIGDPECLPILIPRLAQEPLRNRLVVETLLRRLTAEAIDDRPEAWAAWLTRWIERGLPPLRQETGAPPTGATTKYGSTYYGLPIDSDRIVFVVDISQSMRFSDAEDGRSRMDRAKAELNRTIEGLPRDTRFGILVFSTGNAFFERRALVPATRENKARARDFVEGLKAAGGTNSFGALKAIYEGFADVDGIWFLSDGRPSRGLYTETEPFLARILEMNRRRRVRIHTVAMLGRAGATRQPRDQEAARFMRRLAELTGGSFAEAAP